MRTVFDPILGTLRAEFSVTSSVGAITYFIGGYDASGGTYPSTGGTGSGGAIQKGNLWNITVAGTLPTGVAVEVGDTLLALVDNPGQTQANWLVNQTNIGYVPENIANKSSSYTVSSTTTYANTKALVDGLAIKAPIASPTFTGTVTVPILNISTALSNDNALTELLVRAADGTIKYRASTSIGLTNWTDAINTSAPNGTVPVASLTATNAATNVDAAIIVKGSGALLTQVPDNGTGGGNKRGTYAVDLQMQRSANSQVASGSGAFIGGGSGNTASGTNSVALGQNNTSSGVATLALGGSNTASNAITGSYAIGYNNTASGAAALAMGNSCTASNTGSVSIGTSSTASGTYGFALGQSCTASGANSFTGGYASASSANSSFSYGNNASASGGYSHVIGYYVYDNGIIGRNVHGYCPNGVYGETQKSSLTLYKRTTDGTAATATVDGTAAAVNSQNLLILQNNSAIRFKGMIIGKQSGSTNVAAWDIDGIIVRGANAAATTLPLGNVTLAQNTPGWGTPTLAADTTNGGLTVQVTGAAATNIQWTVTLDTADVIRA